MARVTLPDGGWAELRDVPTLGDRLAFNEALDDAADSRRSVLTAGYQMIVRACREWSYPTEPTMDALELLDVDVVDTLYSALDPFMKRLSPASFDPSPDKTSPTKPSPASEGDAREAEAPSTLPSPNGSESSATGSSSAA